MFRAASSGTKSRVLVLFGYAQTALSADSMFEFCPQKCDKGLLPTILLCTRVLKGENVPKILLKPSKPVTPPPKATALPLFVLFTK